MLLVFLKTPGDAVRVDVLLDLAAVGLERTGETKVGDGDVTVIADENVGKLEIAVDDTEIVKSLNTKNLRSG